MDENLRKLAIEIAENGSYEYHCDKGPYQLAKKFQELDEHLSDSGMLPLAWLSLSLSLSLSGSGPGRNRRD